MPLDNEQDRMQEPAAPEDAKRRARSSVFALPDLASPDDVTALGESLVDALTTEFTIEEVPAPKRAVASERSDVSASNSDTPEASRPEGTSSPALRDEQNADSTGSIAFSPSDPNATVALPKAKNAVSASVSTDAQATVAIPRIDATEEDPFEDEEWDECDYAEGKRAEDGLAGENRNGSFADEAKADDTRVGDVYPDSPEDTAVMDPVSAPASQPVAEKIRRRIHIPWGKVIAAACILLVLAVIGAGVAFAWDRWLRYDDTQDIRGEWQVANTEGVMVIDATYLKIAPDVAYKYTLDTKEKTITYTFGDSEGSASYRFSSDRNTLIIDESTGTDWMMALHLKADTVMEGGDIPEGVTRLVRVSDNVMADPQNMGVSSGDESESSDPFYVEGYTELTQTEKVKPSSNEDDEDKDKDKDSDKDDEETGDPDAAYTDKETGMSYYFDDSLQLYYDMYGNYFYDMYGQNPYEMPLETYDQTYVDDSYLYDESVYYDQGYSEESYY